jgi:hypothetical protein
MDRGGKHARTKTVAKLAAESLTFPLMRIARDLKRVFPFPIRAEREFSLAHEPGNWARVEVGHRGNPVI